jgi:branched-subunit amino acid transport protein
MTALLAIVAVGVCTYLSRAVFIVALARREIPAYVVDSLRYVAPAVLSALVVTLMIDDAGEVRIGVPELVAFLVGATVAYRSRSHIWTLAAGMATYWLLLALVAAP